MGGNNQSHKTAAPPRWATYEETHGNVVKLYALGSDDPNGLVRRVPRSGRGDPRRADLRLHRRLVLPALCRPSAARRRAVAREHGGRPPHRARQRGRARGHSRMGVNGVGGRGRPEQRRRRAYPRDRDVAQGQPGLPEPPDVPQNVARHDLVLEQSPEVRGARRGRRRRRPRRQGVLRGPRSHQGPLRRGRPPLPHPRAGVGAAQGAPHERRRVALLRRLVQRGVHDQEPERGAAGRRQHAAPVLGGLLRADRGPRRVGRRARVRRPLEQETSGGTGHTDDADRNAVEDLFKSMFTPSSPLKKEWTDHGGPFAARVVRSMEEKKADGAPTTPPASSSTTPSRSTP